MTPVAYAEPRAIRAGIARGNRKLNVEGRMSKFNVGDYIICPVGVKVGSSNRGGVTFTSGMERLIGQVMEVDCITEVGNVRARGWTWPYEWIELAEDRTNWHPHHDEIVAWAKGAKIEVSEDGGNSWRRATTPSWNPYKDFRVKPEPDNTAEIDEIEQEMRKLADRLEKLKGD